MLFTSVEYDESKSAYYEEIVKSRFTDFEQSILWQCLNDKHPKLHKDLNEIVRKHLSKTHATLYRGISRTTLHQIENLEVNDTFCMGRVSSFTSNLTTAKTFAGQYGYDTGIVFSIENIDKAFNYQENMLNILLAAPESEFMGETISEGKTERGEKLDMVNDEDEWMFPIETVFRILEIDSNPSKSVAYYVQLRNCFYLTVYKPPSL